jgi:iron complex outermembrane receptor protein
MTDAEGNFHIGRKRYILVSFLGYKTARIAGTEQFVTIELVPSANDLQTVEVLGRSAQRL